MPLSTQEDKWEPANSQRILDKMLRVTYDFRASHKWRVARLLPSDSFSHKNELLFTNRLRITNVPPLLLPTQSFVNLTFGHGVIL